VEIYVDRPAFYALLDTADPGHARAFAFDAHFAEQGFTVTP